MGKQRKNRLNHSFLLLLTSSSSPRSHWRNYIYNISELRTKLLLQENFYVPEQCFTFLNLSSVSSWLCFRQSPLFSLLELDWKIKYKLTNYLSWALSVLYNAMQSAKRKFDPSKAIHLIQQILSPEFKERLTDGRQWEEEEEVSEYKN